MNWLLTILWKIIGRKPRQLPKSYSKYDTSIEVVELADDQSSPLKELVISSGREVIKNSEEYFRMRRLQLLSSHELKNYFDNIWKKISNKHTSEVRFIISPGDIQCSEDDYDVIISLFEDALNEASIDITIEKPNQYYFFGQFQGPKNQWEVVFKQLWSGQHKPLQLSQGAPYR